MEVEQFRVFMKTRERTWLTIRTGSPAHSGTQDVVNQFERFIRPGGSRGGRNRLIHKLNRETASRATPFGRFGLFAPLRCAQFPIDFMDETKTKAKQK